MSLGGGRGFSASLALPTGRIVLDIDRCTVQACPAARLIVGAEFLEAVRRLLNQPRRGRLELTTATRDALNSHRPTHTVLDTTDQITVEWAVFTVNPLSLPARQVECFVVDYTPISGAVHRLSEHLKDVMIPAPGSSQTGRDIEHLADLYLIDELSAYSILHYLTRTRL